MDEADRRQQFFEEVRAKRPDLALLCLLIITKGQGTRVAPREKWKTGDLAAASRAPRAAQTAQPEPQPSPSTAIPGGAQALNARQEPDPEEETTSDTREIGRTTDPEDTADAIPSRRKRKRTHPATAPGESRTEKTGKKTRSTTTQPPHQPSDTQATTTSG
jgi:hypothetical protein